MKIRMMGLAAALSVMTVSVIAPAQGQDYNDGLKEELNQDVNQMYPKRAKDTSVDTLEVQTVKVKQVQPASPAQGSTALPAQAQTNVGPQPIYILQQPAAAPQAQAQPVTNIEATPVKESRGDQLRKQREEVEHQTENKLMERLEDDRLMSEKDRSERIFNPLNANPAASPSPAPGAKAAPVTEAAPVAVVAPVQQQQPEVVPVAAAAPVTAVAVTDDNAVIHAHTDDHFGENDEDRTRFLIGAAGGIASYPSTGNVNGDYAAGISGEMLFPGRLGLEVQALFSQYDVSVPTLYYLPMLETLNQTNITTGLNYHILDGRVSPVVGLLAGYTRRNYATRNNSYGYGYGYGYGYNNSIPGSNAFDGGLKLGVDVNATKKFTVGLAFNYMMNISYRTDNPYQYYGTPLQPLESLNYYFATLNLKLAL